MNWTPFRVLVIVGFVAAVLSCEGCKTPLININRTGSALPDVNILNGNQANGNTVPLVGQ